MKTFTNHIARGDDACRPRSSGRCGASRTRAEYCAAEWPACLNGTVRMTFAAKPGICGSGNSIATFERQGKDERGAITGTRRAMSSGNPIAAMGPLVSLLDRRNGELSDLRFYVGGRWRPAGGDVVDLGTVLRRRSSELSGLDRSDRKGQHGREGDLSRDYRGQRRIWPALIKIARNPDVPRKHEIAIGVLAWPGGGRCGDGELKISSRQ